MSAIEKAIEIMQWPVTMLKYVEILAKLKEMKCSQWQLFNGRYINVQ